MRTLTLLTHDWRKIPLISPSIHHILSRRHPAAIVILPVRHCPSHSIQRRASKEEWRTTNLKASPVLRPYRHQSHPRNLDMLVPGKRIGGGERIEGFDAETRENLHIQAVRHFNAY